MQAKSKLNFKIGIFAVLLILVLVFIFQNMKVVEIRFLIWSFEASRSLVLLVMAGIGFFSGWVFRAYRASRD